MIDATRQGGKPFGENDIHPDGGVTIVLRCALAETGSAAAVDEVLTDCLLLWAHCAYTLTAGEFRRRPHIHAVDPRTAEVVLDFAATAVFRQAFVTELTRRLDAADDVARVTCDPAMC